MAPLDFSNVAFPDTAPEPSTASDDLTCETCGTALTYAGKGRKPRFCDEHKANRSTGPTRARGNPKPVDVDRACESLNALYTGLTFPLLALSPRAAQTWADQLEPLDARNHTFLATNRKLVDQINSGAEKGGTVAFIISHVIAVAPVLIVLRVDLAGRGIGGNVSDFPEPEPEPLDPDAAFR